MQNDPRFGQLLSSQGIQSLGLPYSILDYAGYNKVPSLGITGEITYVDPFIGQENVAGKPSFNNNIKDILAQNYRSNLPLGVIQNIYKGIGINPSFGLPGLSPTNVGLQETQEYFKRNNIPVIKTPPLDAYYKGAN